jgi:beta-catenin-like protein 1
MSDLVNALIERLDSKNEDDDSFIKSAQFQGPRDGYQFQNGRKGLGYYKENNNDDDDDDSFIKSAQFQGPRDGYEFQNGRKGLGYYKENSNDDDDDINNNNDDNNNNNNKRRKTTTKEQSKGINYDLLLEQIEKNNPDITEETMELNERTVKKLVLTFERALKENMEKRAKFSREPQKFLDSEVDLDLAIKNLQSICAQPRLYFVLIDTKCVKSLLSILAHENEDICIDILNLFRELFDPDSINEGEEDENRQAFQLLNAVKDNDGIKMLIDCLMDRFFINNSNKNNKTSKNNEAKDDLLLAAADDDEQKRNAEETILQIVENLIEISGGTSEICEYFLNDKNTRLREYLLERVGKKHPTDGVKLQASELLSILITGSDEQVKESLLLATDSTIMEPVMMALAVYKKKEPEDGEEREIVENLADVICALLSNSRLAQDTFEKLEGIELMILCVKSKLFVRSSALKILDFQLTGNEQSCLRFIDVFGLKTIFSTFVNCFGGEEKKLKKLKKKYGNDYVDSECERTLSIIASLFQNIDVSESTEKYNRVVSKFVEESFVKLDLLIESYVLYGKRVSKIDHNNNNTYDSEEEQEIYIEKLDNGLSSLENVAIIIAHLWATLDDAVQKRIFIDLDQNEIDVSHIRDVLRDRAKNIGDLNGSRVQKDKVEQILTLVYSLYMPNEKRPGD